MRKTFLDHLLDAIESRDVHALEDALTQGGRDTSNARLVALERALDIQQADLVTMLMETRINPQHISSNKIAKIVHSERQALYNILAQHGVDFMHAAPFDLEARKIFNLKLKCLHTQMLYQDAQKEITDLRQTHSKPPEIAAPAATKPK